MSFEIVGDITEIETIARGVAIRDLKRLRKQFGGERWRKLRYCKGQAGKWYDKAG